MGRFRRSWELMKASWNVLRQDRELLLLPVLSLVATVGIAAIFAIPVLSSIDFDAPGRASQQLGPLQWVLIAIAYFACAYVAVFFMTALVAAADKRLRGGDPTLGWAIGQARRRALQILPWVLIMTTVGLILRAIQERLGFIGRLLIGALGVVWSVLTFLVLPVLVVENVGVVDGIKRSAALAKRSWGENVIGNGGIGLVAGLAGAIPAILLFGAGAAMVSISLAVAVVFFGLALLWVLAVSVFASALSGVYQVALYAYAAHGSVPTAFAQAGLPQAFQQRGRRR